MSFLSILLALLLEQARPLASANPVYSTHRNWVRWVVRNFDAGKLHHGWLTWTLAVGVPCLLVVSIHWALLIQLGWLAAAAWNVAVLYVTLGFRQFSHHFTIIRDALYEGDETLAREELARWMSIDARELPRSEMVRHVIEHSVLAAHRHVFGVFAWYSLLAAFGLGPAGAVFYRLTEFVGRYVNRPIRPTSMPHSPALTVAGTRAWHLVDWLPSRVTALSFAFVGSFEDAVDSWRRFEARCPGSNDGIVMAATSGAVGVKLGAPEQELGGDVPQPSHLRAVVGLVWRTVVMWMVFLALLSLARLIG